MASHPGAELTESLVLLFYLRDIVRKARELKICVQIAFVFVHDVAIGARSPAYASGM